MKRAIGLCVALLASGVVSGAEANSATPREYELYMDWKDGREDPRLEKYSSRYIRLFEEVKRGPHR